MDFCRTRLIRRVIYNNHQGGFAVNSRASYLHFFPFVIYGILYGRSDPIFIDEILDFALI